MKYTICGFQQDVLVKLGLDSIDAVILRWFVDFYHTDKMEKKIIAKKQYVWVRYQSICDSLPIIQLQKKPIYRRFVKYTKCGLMLHKNIKGSGPHNTKGNWSYFYLVPTVYAYLVDNSVDKQAPKDLKVPTLRTLESQGLGFERPNKDSSINDSSINNNKYTPFQAVQLKKTVDNLKKNLENNFQLLGKNSKLTEANTSMLLSFIEKEGAGEVKNRIRMFTELSLNCEEPISVYEDYFNVEEILETGINFDYVNDGKINFFGFSQVFPIIRKVYENQGVKC